MDKQAEAAPSGSSDAAWRRSFVCALNQVVGKRGGAGAARRHETVGPAAAGSGTGTTVRWVCYGGATWRSNRQCGPNAEVLAGVVNMCILAANQAPNQGAYLLERARIEVCFISGGTAPCPNLQCWL